jgi:NAD-dependent dihydropyrimidine dehydrogenase PreA subunit
MTTEATTQKPAQRTRGHIVIRVDECKGCGCCVGVCPRGVLELAKGLNRMGYHPCSYKGDGCIACGFCFYSCPEPGAITVYVKDEGE